MTTTHASMHATTHAPKTDRPAGPLQWRRIVEWLRADGVISEEEARSTWDLFDEILEHA